MARVTLNENILTDIADAIRNKNGTTGGITPENMATDISNITTGTEPVLQDKIVEPKLEEQTVEADDGYDGLDTVTVKAIKTTALAEPMISVDEQNGVITVSQSQSDGYVVSQELITEKQLPTQEFKTITPTKELQIAVEGGTYATGDILVSAIPNEYIVTTDATATASDILNGETAYVNGNKITGTMQAVTQAIPSISINSSGLITASATQSAGYVSAGTKSETEQLTTQAAKTIIPTKSSQTAVASGVYTTGNITVDAIPNEYITTTDATATANEILSGKTAYVDGEKITGTIPITTLPATNLDLDRETGLITATTFQGEGYTYGGTSTTELQLFTKGTETIIPTTENQTITAGKYLTGHITVKGDSNLVASNIKSGVSIFGINGTLETVGGDNSEAIRLLEGTASVCSNSKVIILKDYIFYCCSNLTSVDFPNCSYIGNAAFGNCFLLTLANFPNCNYIDNSAFWGCANLTSIISPNCNYIGHDTFSECFNLSSINFPNCSYVGNAAFYGCVNLSSAVFPSCNKIDNNAFYRCFNLSSIDFPNCSYVGNAAFANCSNLTSAIFPNCSYVGSNAFINCYKLTSASFPNCNYIGQFAFEYNRTLSSFTLDTSTVCTLNHSNAFKSTPYAGYSSYFSGTPYIYVPASLVDAYKSATNWTYFSKYISAISDSNDNNISNFINILINSQPADNNDVSLIDNGNNIFTIYYNGTGNYCGVELVRLQEYTDYDCVDEGDNYATFKFYNLSMDTVTINLIIE